MLRVVFFAGMLLIGNLAMSQKEEYIIEYINTYKQIAVEEMIRTGVPASIKLAQGIHETEAGHSDLVTRSNNHFGIKCKTGWQGDKVYHDDDARGECFRSYSSSNDSYKDHSDFLKNSSRYAFLFQLDPTDYKAWAYGLKKAGYATNIKYSQILIKLIEQYNLQQYSLIALGKLSADDEILAGIKRPGPGSIITAGPAAPVPPALEELAMVVRPSYPEGEFIINKTRVVFAKSGTSLLSVAKLYDISLKRLFDFNDLQKEDVLIEDQLIFLQRKRKIGADEYHTVQPGETLYGISQSEGIRLESLMQYNFLKSTMRPAIGEKLYLQNEAPSQPRLATDESNRMSGAIVEPMQSYEKERPVDIITHVVRPKETLYGIAKNYNTTTDKIKEWNKLPDAHLKKGQELIIYKN